MKKVFYISLLLIIPYLTMSESLKPGFRMIADFHSYPWFYDSYSGLQGTAFQGMIQPGITLNNITLSLSVRDEYFSISRQDNPESNYGAWNILKGYISCLIRIHRFFELEAGAGGGWYRSSMNTNSVGSYSMDKGGAGLILNGTIRFPFPYIRLGFHQSFDLFFQDKSVTVAYLGGLRLYFQPYIDWLTLYIDLSGMPWDYHTPPYSMTTGFFLWGAGISMDLTFPRPPAKKPENKIKDPEIKIEPESGKMEEIKIKEPDHPEIPDADQTSDRELEAEKKLAGQLFSRVILNKEFRWEGSFFGESSAKLLEETIPAMNALKRHLIDHPSLIIEITGYAFYTGNSTKELKLCIDRARAFRNFLVQSGIPQNRMIIPGDGIIIGIYGEQGKKPYIRLIFKENI